MSTPNNLDEAERYFRATLDHGVTGDHANLTRLGAALGLMVVDLVRPLVELGVEVEIELPGNPRPRPGGSTSGDVDDLEASEPDYERRG